MKTIPLAQKIRSDFPILRRKVNGYPLIYFDSAATSQKPQCVIDALSHFYSEEYGTVHRGIYDLSMKATEKYHQSREKIANFIGAKSPSEIVFTRGTTDGINLLALSLSSTINQDDEILVSEMEHHSNFVPWQLLCQKTKAKLKIIPINEKGELDLDAFTALISPKTKLVAVAHIANSTGTINPIETLIKVAHANGAMVLIDAAQTISHHPIDVDTLDIDFLAFSGHKAFGPTGIGVLYGKYSLLEKLPPVYGGGDMVDQVTLDTTTFQNPPLRFEAGTPPIAQVVGLAAAVRYIEEVGIESIFSWEQELLFYATERLKEISGLRIIGNADKKGGIISFVIEGIHHLDLATFLDLKGIAIRSGHHCAQPLLQRFGLTGTNRISFSPFNTFEEIDQFLLRLRKAAQQLSF